MAIIQWIRSLIFVLQMYLAMAVIALLLLPYALIGHKQTIQVMRLYTIWVRWTARWMVGIKSEIRGNIPTGDVIVAAKHQSFLDIILIFNVLPNARFVMKKEILRTPFVGFYGRRIGCIAIDRSSGADAMNSIRTSLEADGTSGQLIIFPQGTRVPPGVSAPYKFGVAIIQEQTGLPVHPVANNVGYFWPRKGIMRKPGTAVVEFLDPLPVGLERTELMAQLETVIEDASNILAREV